METARQRKSRIYETPDGGHSRRPFSDLFPFIHRFTFFFSCHLHPFIFIPARLSSPTDFLFNPSLSSSSLVYPLHSRPPRPILPQTSRLVGLSYHHKLRPKQCLFVSSVHSARTIKALLVVVVVTPLPPSTIQGHLVPFSLELLLEMLVVACAIGSPSRSVVLLSRCLDLTSTVQISPCCPGQHHRFRSKLGAASA